MDDKWREEPPKDKDDDKEGKGGRWDNRTAAGDGRFNDNWGKWGMGDMVSMKNFLESEFWVSLL